MWDEAGRLTDWLGDIPVEAQLLKLSEEVGEVAEAYLGLHGYNPRKGVNRTPADLAGELADVIITAAVASVRIAGGADAARLAFQAHLAGVVARAGLDGDPAPPTGKPER